MKARDHPAHLQSALRQPRSVPSSWDPQLFEKLGQGAHTLHNGHPLCASSSGALQSSRAVSFTVWIAASGAGRGSGVRAGCTLLTNGPPLRAGCLARPRACVAGAWRLGSPPGDPAAATGLGAKCCSGQRRESPSFRVRTIWGDRNKLAARAGGAGPLQALGLKPCGRWRRRALTPPSPPGPRLIGWYPAPPLQAQTSWPRRTAA